MITREQSRQILDEVKANIARLEACPGPHDFVPMQTRPAPRVRMQCTRCGGEVDSVNYAWYMRGRRHAAGELPADQPIAACG